MASFLCGVVVLYSFLTTHLPEMYALTCNYPGSGGDDCDTNCNVLGFCQSNGILIPNANCQESGKYCDISTSTCQDDLDYECVTAQKGKCATEGKFPSLTDCTSYYVCASSGDEVFATKCPGKAYNSCTKGCTDPLTTDGLCSTTAITCAEGLKGPAPGNDNQYYECVYSGGKWTPQWRQCDGNKRYSVSAGGCKDVGSISSCTTCGATSTVPGSNPIAGNSCRYIWCFANKDFEVKSCTTGWHYDHSQRGCVIGAC